MTVPKILYLNVQVVPKSSSLAFSPGATTYCIKSSKKRFLKLPQLLILKSDIVVGNWVKSMRSITVIGSSGSCDIRLPRKEGPEEVPRTVAQLRTVPALRLLMPTSHSPW